MSTRLFTKNGSYTDLATKISTKFSKEIQDSMEYYPELDMRDLILITLEAAHDACICYALDNKKD